MILQDQHHQALVSTTHCHLKLITYLFISLFAFSALTLLVGRQERHPSGMCTRPFRPRPRRDLRRKSARPRRDRDIGNYVRDETL